MSGLRAAFLFQLYSDYFPPEAPDSLDAPGQPGVGLGQVGVVEPLFYIAGQFRQLAGPVLASVTPRSILEIVF